MDDMTAAELRMLRESIVAATVQQAEAQREVADALRSAMASRSSSIAIADAGAAAQWHRATAASNARTAMIILVPILCAVGLWVALELRELRARIDYDEQRIAILEKVKS